MEFTGERAIPGQTDPDLMNEHWARYAFAEALVGSKRVLDAGCGVGYGATRLAEVAAEVVALDQARDPLTAGGKQYSHPRLRFVQGDCTRFPFADSSLDAVVAFEVIEHLDEWKALIEESRRVLAPAGQFIVSTPNRLYYGETREDPNPFHVHEFTHDEFREELGRCFPHVMLFLENHADALVFAGEQFQGIRARLETADQAPDEAHFFLAVCSQWPLHDSQAFVYLPSSANLLREREKHIGLLQGEVNKRTNGWQRRGLNWTSSMRFRRAPRGPSPNWSRRTPTRRIGRSSSMASWRVSAPSGRNASNCSKIPRSG